MDSNLYYATFRKNKVSWNLKILWVFVTLVTSKLYSNKDNRNKNSNNAR